MINLENKIYLALKNAITNRRLPPGTKLSEVSLSQKLNASRTPIRSALKGLSYEGLVQIFPNRGAYVAQPTAQEVKEVFEMRILLEEHAVEKACQNINPSEKSLLKLQTFIENEASYYEKNNFNKVLGEVTNFHMEIARFAKNKILIKNIQEMLALSTIYQTFYSDVDTRKPNSPREHKEILSAVLEQNVTLAKQRMAQHIQLIIDRFNFNLMQYPVGSVGDIINEYYGNKIDT
jgi:DNA-binding GntR family transcriptional regulator